MGSTVLRSTIAKYIIAPRTATLAYLQHTNLVSGALRANVPLYNASLVAHVSDLDSRLLALLDSLGNDSRHRLRVGKRANEVLVVNDVALGEPSCDVDVAQRARRGESHAHR